MAEHFGSEKLDHKFKTPEEELSYLRAKVSEHEKTLVNMGEKVPQDKVIKDEIVAHSNRKPSDVLDENLALKTHEMESIVLDLSPEAHDTQMGELVSILQEKGVLNALSVVIRLRNPHLEDDFHRFLVQYIKAGFRVAHDSEKSPVLKALKMTLFEVSLPTALKDEAQKNKNLKELISKMEQFYSGMFSVSSDDTQGSGYFVLELSKAIKSHEIVFYISIPNSKRSLFEKQVQSIFPDVVLHEKKDDYNIFNESGDYVGSVASFAKNDIFPIKTYDQYDYDPLNVLLNSFSKVDKDGEGASIQIIVKPEVSGKADFYKRVLKEMEKGSKFKDALNKADSSLFGTFKRIGKEILISKKDDKKEDNSASNATPIENIKAKISSPVANINIRVLASSNTKEEAMAILSDIESSFNQFENTNGNKFKFERIEGKKILDLVRDFSFRIFSEKNLLNINLKELTTIMHLPEADFSSASQLKKTEASSAPAPLDLPNHGILLGTNKYRNIDTPIRITPEDRLRHFYIIGQTGTGKTTLLKTMIRQDILAGEGVCMIDPHGSDIQEVLSFIPPERYNDVIYFDPSYTERPMGLNMLEYDTRFPEQKTFVVNELFSIFQKLYGKGNPEALGPMFEQYFRNATMLVIEDPETGSTLLDVSRVMVDKTFRELKLSRCKNPVVVQFWKEIAGKAGGEASLANVVPYITSKFDIFLSNEIMRPIVSQEKSAFDFRDIMDNKKILLVNLAKGRLGDINSNLIGLIIVGKLLMAALSRTDSFGKDFAPFYLYIDEFQNVTTDSISTILSEARKYKLALTVAHQFIAQLDEQIKNSVFGNVGSMSVFRVSSEDAEYLEKQFTPIFKAKDLMNIDNHNSYVKMLSNGRPVKPFSMETNMPPRGTKLLLDKIKQLSYLKYGKDRQEVENAVLEKYKKPEPIVPKI